MNPHQPTVHSPGSQLRDDQRRDEARRDEQERRRIEEDILDFDSIAFYEELQEWADQKIVPYRNVEHISLRGKEVTASQPLPVPRMHFRKLYSLSKRAFELVSLLHTAEKKGFDCPYIHQEHKSTLEAAIAKCTAIKEGIVRFRQSPGMVSKLLYLLHRAYVRALERETDKLQARLEAVLLMCRHAEFAQDIVRLRRAVTYRTGYVLGPDDAAPKVPVPRKRVY